MTTANLQARRVPQDHVHTAPELRWSRLPPVDRESEPTITDAPFSYAELRDLDAAVNHLRAAARAVDAAVRSTSAPAIAEGFVESALVFVRMGVHLGRSLGPAAPYVP